MPSSLHAVAALTQGEQGSCHGTLVASGILAAFERVCASSRNTARRSDRLGSATLRPAVVGLQAQRAVTGQAWGGAGGGGGSAALVIQNLLPRALWGACWVVGCGLKV